MSTFNFLARVLGHNVQRAISENMFPMEGKYIIHHLSFHSPLLQNGTLGYNLLVCSAVQWPVSCARASLQARGQARLISADLTRQGIKIRAEQGLGTPGGKQRPSQHRIQEHKTIVNVFL